MIPDERYLFWLIPCVLSSSASVLVLYNILSCPKTRTQHFQHLCGVFAVSDIVQTSVTFLGNHGRGGHHLAFTFCSIQNYGLELGLLCKLATVLTITGQSWYIIDNLKIPSNKRALLSYSILAAFALVSVCIYLGTSDVYCKENFDYSDATYMERAAANFLLFIFILTYCCIFILGIFCILISRKMTAMVMRIGNSQEEIHLLLIRLQAFPVCLVLCFVPVTVAFAYLFFSGSISNNDAYDCVTGACISINGFLISLAYFYHQKELCPLFLRLCGDRRALRSSDVLPGLNSVFHSNANTNTSSKYTSKVFSGFSSPSEVSNDSKAQLLPANMAQYEYCYDNDDDDDDDDDDVSEDVI